MKKNFHFTFNNLERQFKVALDLGYKVITCQKYAQVKNKPNPLTLVNRVDIEYSCTKAGRLLEIFNRLGIKATFFVRLHAPEYNPFSFESYRILKEIRDTGHEIGYHSEIIDQSAIWKEDAAECLRRDIDILNDMLDIQIKGVASHGGNTGLNNLDFWKNRSAKEFDLLYEAYDKSSDFGLFEKSLYISDSEWIRWKCYDKGKLLERDYRTFEEHLTDKPSLVYLLIHPDTYFERHIYE